MYSEVQSLSLHVCHCTFRETKTQKNKRNKNHPINLCVITTQVTRPLGTTGNLPLVGLATGRNMNKHVPGSADSSSPFSAASRSTGPSGCHLVAQSHRWWHPSQLTSLSPVPHLQLTHHVKVYLLSHRHGIGEKERPLVLENSRFESKPHHFLDTWPWRNLLFRFLFLK